MEIKYFLDKGAHAPVKAFKHDAGFDLKVPDGVEPWNLVVRGHDSVVIDTGVHVEIPEGYVGMVKSKSGLNLKHNLTAEGVVDAGYTGSIRVKMYNHGTENYHFKPNDKLTQLVILPIPDIDMVQVDGFDKVTERGDNGFGSSGR